MRLSGPLRALALAAAVAAAACGGDDAAPSGSPSSSASSSSSTAVDACALVTQAEADRALGAASKQDRPSEANIPPRLSTCRYTAPRGEGLAVMTVMLRIGSSAAEAKSSFQGTRDVAPTEAVANLGDEAFWLADQLYVLKGMRSMTLAGDIQKDTAEQLARTAVERLK